MKTRILHWTSVLLASTALLFSACSKDEDNGEKVLPIFPEMQDLTIYEGVQQVDLTFSANLDWTISLPLDAETSRWFQLSDGVMPASVISGKAGTDITIYVITHDEEEFDENPTCEVMLTMGGETKPIAKITRTNASRNFDIFLSGYTIDENTQEKINFSYEYSQTPVDKYTESSESESASELIWFIGQTGYTQAFKVENNFDWLVSTPDWLTVTARPLEGEYFITADFDKITEQEVNGTIGIVDFYDRYIDPTTDPGNNAHNRYAFALPDLTKVMRSGSSMTGSTYEFNIEGKVIDSYGAVSDSPCTGDVYSTAGLKFYVAVKDDQGYYCTGTNSMGQNITDWVTIEDTWDENGSAFQQHTYTVSVTENTGEPREAILIALPKTMAEEISYPDYQLFDMERTELKEQYKSYQLATINQEGPIKPASKVIALSQFGDISAFSPKWDGSPAIATFNAVDETYFTTENQTILAEVKAAFEAGTPVYELTYSDNSPATNMNAMLDINPESDGTVTVSSSAQWLDSQFMPANLEWGTPNVVYPNMDVKTEGGASIGKSGDIGYLTIKLDDTVIAYLICVRKF